MTALVTKMGKIIGYFWWLRLLVVIKSYIIVQWLLKATPKEDPIHVERGLGQVFNNGYGYNILNQKNVTFLMRPGPCTEDVQLVLMVSSGPSNSVLRSKWRKEVEHLASIKLVFLIAMARSEREQSALVSEKIKYGDIVQSSVPDGHRLLAYKILMGYVWTYNDCGNVPYVGKTDDNVELDLARLMVTLQSRRDKHDQFIACSVPSRNIATGRLARPHMRGNWSLTKDQLEADRLPDFCTGFLYVTRPSVGAALAQAGLEMFRNSEDIVITEDYLIAGVLRERLGEVEVESLRQEGLVDKVWEDYLSHCPWLVTVQQTFFNDLVKSKRSSRHNVQYVGSLTNWTVWRFFICLHIESLLESVELRLPGIVPDLLWDVCER